MPPTEIPPATIRPVSPDEIGRLERLISERWGSSCVTSRGTLHRVSELPCLVAVDGDRWLGLAAYRLSGGACELVLLEAFERGHGTGSALLEAVAAIAREARARRLWLITTNDNTDALRFYQRRGMRLVRVWPDAVTQARQLLKPAIPLIGEHGIPIRDELELELPLVAVPSARGQASGRRSG
jgi:GNAT superfamily N-acetyltransferase